MQNNLTTSMLTTIQASTIFGPNMSSLSSHMNSIFFEMFKFHGLQKCVDLVESDLEKSGNSFFKQVFNCKNWPWYHRERALQRSILTFAHPQISGIQIHIQIPYIRVLICRQANPANHQRRLARVPLTLNHHVCRSS